MTRRSICTCLCSGILAMALLAPALVYGEHTHFWRQSDYSDFEKGTAKGVAIRSDGKLVPAPQFASLSDPNLLYLWALRTDSRGRVYAAGGSDAKVLRFDDPAKPTTVFEAPELSAQTIAFDARDNLYVGTSPDGKVYKVTPDGQKSVFFDPKAKYIWALALDVQGTLFVGTGDKGEIYSVTPDGKGQLFYQSDERHARSLAFDPKGNLLVGTDPDGLILRIEISRATAAKDSQAAPKRRRSLRRLRNRQKRSHIAAHGFQRKSLRRGDRRKAAPRRPQSSTATHRPTVGSARSFGSRRRHAGAPGRRRRATASCLFALPFHHRRLAGRENIAVRLAGNAVDLARRSRFFHGPCAERKSPARHWK